MNLTSSIRTTMEHNALFRKLVPALQKSQLVYLLHKRGYDKQGADCEATREFQRVYAENKAEFEQVESLLFDERSKQTYRAIIDFRSNHDLKALKPFVSYPQYFGKDIFPAYDNEVFVDGGAYTGDTVLSYAKHGGKGRTAKVYAWEPDTKNAAALRRVGGGDGVQPRGGALCAVA